MTGRRISIAAAALSGLALLQVAGATMGSGAAFTSSSKNPAGQVSSGDWTAPLVTLADPGSPLRGTVALTATATDAIGAVASVRIQRSSGAGWTDVCAPAPAPSTCSWNTAALADGSYDLRAVATDDSGNTGTSAVAANRVVANALPTVAMGNPGSPLRGSVTLSATASSLAGITSVRVQRLRAGTSTWTDVCTDASAPYTCALDTTTLADELFSFRAVATDTLGGTTTSAAVASIEIDNAAPTVTLADPGSPLSGTVNLTATAADADSGVASVLFQVSPAGQGSWTDLCADEASPFACGWDTTALANGSYDLRARVTDRAGNTVTSAVVANRSVANVVAPAGFDVQTTNAQTPGRLAAGDTMTLTWTKAMAPASLVPGWSGVGPVTVYARLRDGGGSGSADVLDFWTNSAATGPTGLGTVGLNGDFVSTGGTVIFTALASLSTVTVNGASASAVTISLLSASGSGALRTNGTDVAMTWLPSASATDTSGVAASSAAVSESGALDRDF
jgi:hypothetical protein